MMKNPNAGVKLGAPSRTAPDLSPGLAALVKVARPVSTPAPVPSTLGAPMPMAQPTFNIRAAGYAEGGMVTPNGPAVGGAPMQPGGPQLGAQGAAQPPMAMNQLKGQLEQFMRAQPQAVQKVKEAIQEALNSGAMTMEDLQMAVQMAVAAAQNPELWPRLRQLAIQRGLATEEELPQQYDQGIVFALMLAGGAVAQEGGGAAAPAPQAPQAQPAPANMAMGGKVPVSASPTRNKSGVADDIPIKVSAGEYVIPKHIVEQKGTDFFDKLIGKDIAK